MNSDTNSGFMDFYKVLQCNKNDTIDDIKKSYQNLLRNYHPDKKEIHADADTFLLVQKAWTVLRDPIKRKQYDAELTCQENLECLVYAHLNLMDLQHNKDMDSFEYSCRCGGTYSVLASQLKENNIMVGCDECSFCIEITIPDASKYS